MKVALIGYGKMGKAVEEILLQKGHEIPLKISHTPSTKELEGVDVAVEFSKPEFAYQNLKVLLENNIPSVSGTTGWLSKQEEINKIALDNNTAFIYASNFSLGVNLFFDLNKKLAKLMNRYKDDYKVKLEEIHHTKKLDAPSGTAITVAKQIIEETTYDSWSLDKKSENTIPIDVKRVGNVPGTHIVQYNSDIDTIEISHTAHSRQGFALGAVIAAEWILGKKGIFSMKDVLELN